MKGELKFIPGTLEGITGIQCPDGRMLVLDCTTRRDLKFLARITARYNMFSEIASELKAYVLNDLSEAECPFCGRDNRNDRRCTSNDCPGVQLLEQVKECNESDESDESN